MINYYAAIFKEEDIDGITVYAYNKRQALEMIKTLTCEQVLDAEVIGSSPEDEDEVIWWKEDMAEFF